jgi:hypothetical protein
MQKLQSASRRDAVLVLANSQQPIANSGFAIAFPFSCPLRDNMDGPRRVA